MSVSPKLAFETNNATFQFIEDDILLVKRSEREADFSDPKKNMLELQEHLEGKRVKILMNNTGFPYAGKETRMTSMDLLHHVCSALAIVAETKEGFGIASIFIASNKTDCPMKIFDNETAAKQWLEQLS